MTEPWRDSWRRAVAPQLAVRHLLALCDALETDDAALIEGCTTEPVPTHVHRGLAPEGACAIGYAGWWGDALLTVGEVHDFYHAVLRAGGGDALDQPAAAGFVVWWDSPDVPRRVKRLALLSEVDGALAARAAAGAITHNEE